MEKIKKFCESLKEHATRIIRFEKKKMLPLTNKELKACEEARICYIFRKQFVKNSLMMLTIKKLKIIATIQVNIEVQHTAFVV